MTTENNEPSGRPIEPIADENIRKVQKIILDDHIMRWIGIAGITKTSRESVGTVHQYLGTRKLGAKCVPPVAIPY